MSVDQAKPTANQDAELKARHRTMWASGDYPTMVQTWLTPLGPRLVQACQVTFGQAVLDVATGTGNAAVPAARTGAHVTASDLTPELLEAGQTHVGDELPALEWTVADAEQLPFADESFDVVMSCIGAMFAPRHQRVADELHRVCRPGGAIGLLSWTPEGMIGELFRTMKPYAPTPAPGAQPAPLWGSEEHVRELFGDRVQFRTLARHQLEVTAFETPGAFANHFAENYGPTLVARANARRNDQETALLKALDDFAADWNRGTPEQAQFNLEYLLAIGTRT